VKFYSFRARVGYVNYTSLSFIHGFLSEHGAKDNAVLTQNATMSFQVFVADLNVEY
jgi:hypothetical protein